MQQLHNFKKKIRLQSPYLILTTEFKQVQKVGSQDKL